MSSYIWPQISKGKISVNWVLARHRVETFVILIFQIQPLLHLSGDLSIITTLAMFLLRSGDTTEQL